MSQKSSPSLPAVKSPPPQDAKIMPTLSKALDALLKGSDDQTSIETIAGNSALLAEARTVMPLMRHRAAMPATMAEIMKIIGSRFMNYPGPHMEPEEWDNWWKGYGDMLAGVSAASVEIGLQDWLRAHPDEQFLPKPNALRASALLSVSPVSRAYAIANAADRLEQRRREQRGALQPDFSLTHPRAPKTAESRDAVSAMAAGIVEKLKLVRPATVRGAAQSGQRFPVSEVYRSLMNQGLERSRSAAPTELQRIAATLDENSQGRLAPGSALTPGMIRHLGSDRSVVIAMNGGLPIPPGGRDVPPAPLAHRIMDDWG